MDILITTHGKLAEGLVSALSFITGTTENVSIVELDEMGIDNFRQRLHHKFNETSHSLIVLTDLKGGTPYNESFVYYLEHSEDIRVVSGVNLPMLIELATQVTSLNDLDQAVTIACEAGTNGVSVPDVVDDDDDMDF
ncbi:PTS sugar transporter subunit IIA [Weissella hellenica]|uniref:PTS N'-diacetylchitobiose transporter subunit IIA n=1 Tax=Weissella hellenica TaxID=46256 RepID=A0A4Y4G859_WEIHE|nr:hypothetical protein [Weissella hellenica]NKY66122.1 PTS N'-diacetylchitobiose transporter subunit IIA [Weissella hellenica]GED35578.1 PTS sugar transporter subunit IIA [Weissella hellenica]SCB79753.1 PTS system, mannose-specific IIA component [Weissella hellenica]